MQVCSITYQVNAYKQHLSGKGVQAINGAICCFYSFRCKKPYNIWFLWI